MDYEAIANSEKDTSKLIFDYRFQVSVPHQESRSIGDLRRYGTRTSDLPELNSSVMKQKRVCYLSINEMTEFYDKGLPVSVIKEADCKAIYQFITAHIDFWKDQMLKSVHQARAPLEDLILLDEFAASVYKHARHQMRDPAFVEAMRNNLSGQQIVDFNKLFTGWSPDTGQFAEKTTAKHEREKFPEHEGSQEYFKRRLVSTAGFGARNGRRN